MKPQPYRSKEHQTERLLASIRMSNTRLFKVLYPILEWTTDKQDPSSPDWYDPKGFKRVVNDIAIWVGDCHLKWEMYKVDRRYR